MQTARFWEYIHGSPVKITLRSTGRNVLRHSHGGPTDEGWSAEAYVWSLDGYLVRCEYTTAGSDCDGRHTSYSDTGCPIGFLQSGYREETDPAIAYPEWQRISASQRDQFAEAMGY